MAGKVSERLAPLKDLNVPWFVFKYQTPRAPFSFYALAAGQGVELSLRSRQGDVSWNDPKTGNQNPHAFHNPFR